MTIEEAIEVFVAGFCLTKSQAHPYIARQVDGLWVLQDGPGRRNPRKIEIITTGKSPEEVISSIRAAGLGWHFLCHIHDLETDYDAIRAGYKALGYRALSTEGFFINDLSGVPEFVTDPPTRLVATRAEADLIPRIGTFRHKLIPRTRLLVAWDEQTDYGWVTSIPVGKAAWVSGLYVRDVYRRQGFGRGIMSKMLQTDLEHGVKTSVLLASSDGARLYPHLGYRKIGVLQMFCPIKRF